MTIALLLIVLASAPESPSPKPVEVVALAYAASGTASVRLPDGTSRRIQDVARLVGGSTVELPAKAALRIAFLDGRRFGLHGPARALVGRDGLRVLSGSYDRLEPVPPLPHLAAIWKDEAGDRMGAIRLRSGEIGGLSPETGATVLTDEVILRFAAVAGARVYAVEVRDAGGKIVLTQTTPSSQLAVPAGTLEPGRSYSWTVETTDATGMRMSGQADFATLAREEVAARDRFRAAAATQDPELLRALDLELGLSAPATTGHIADGR